MEEFIKTLLIGFFITVIVMLIFREILCWYWKLNRIVGLLESIDLKLGKTGSTSKVVSPDS